VTGDTAVARWRTEGARARGGESAVLSNLQAPSKVICRPDESAQCSTPQGGSFRAV
ncbi:hypothetical protein V5799_029412, partial [Amblyomma americanum]